MKYTVLFKPAAIKQLSRCSHEVQMRVAAVVDKLAVQPRPMGVKKLAGFKDLYRIRVGDYRVVYTIEDKKLIILVVGIAHRRDVYR